MCRSLRYDEESLGVGRIAPQPLRYCWSIIYFLLFHLLVPLFWGLNERSGKPQGYDEVT